MNIDESAWPDAADSAPQSGDKRPPRRSFSARAFGWKTLLMFVLILTGWAGAAYYHQQYTGLRNDPQVAAQLESAQLLTDVASIIELPQNELPSIATVSDVTALANEPFFAQAQNGDVLIVYAQSERAYLYRPAEKKLINVGTFVQQPSVPAEAFADSPDESSEASQGDASEVEQPIDDAEQTNSNEDSTE